MRTWTATGAAGALLAVMLGAWVSHGLDEAISAQGKQALGTAVDYLMYHSVAILLCCALPLARRWEQAAVWCFTLGMLCFSGSIFMLTLTTATWLWPVTPIGGTLLMGGWACVIFGAVYRRANG